MRAGGLEPPWPCGQRIFVPSTAFAALAVAPSALRLSLWSGLSLRRAPPRHSRWGLGAARLVSTPSPCGAWLGIAFAGFPEFEQFCTLRFRQGHSIYLSPLRLPISPRPRISPNDYSVTNCSRQGLIACFRVAVVPRGFLAFRVHGTL